MSCFQVLLSDIQAIHDWLWIFEMLFLRYASPQRILTCSYKNFSSTHKLFYTFDRTRKTTLSNQSANVLSLPFEVHAIKWESRWSSLSAYCYDRFAVPKDSMHFGEADEASSIENLWSGSHPWWLKSTPYIWSNFLTTYLRKIDHLDRITFPIPPQRHQSGRNDTLPLKQDRNLPAIRSARILHHAE